MASSDGTTRPKRRNSGAEETVFQRCDRDRGCPDMIYGIAVRKKRRKRDYDGSSVADPAERKRLLAWLEEKLAAVDDPKDKSEQAVSDREMIAGHLNRLSETDPGDDYKLMKIRPKHRCRGMWAAQKSVRVGADVVRPTAYGATKQRALENFDILKAELEASGGQALKHKRSFKLFSAWVEYYMSDIWQGRPRTRSDYESLDRKFIVPHLGHLHFRSELDAQAVRDLYKWMGENGHVGRRPNVHRHLKAMIKRAKREGVVTRDIMELVDAPSGAGGSRTAQVPDVARRILLTNRASEDRLASRWDSALLAGMRQGECLGMEPDRINLSDDTLLVSWQLQRLPFIHGCARQAQNDAWPCGKRRAGYCPSRTWHIDNIKYEVRQLDGGLCLVRPKSTKSWRRLPIVPWVRTSIVRRLELLEDERSAYTDDVGLLWCQPDGRPIRPNDDRKEWKQLLYRADVPLVDEHTVRHTLATLLLEAKEDVHVVESLLGHADEKTTRGYQTVDVRILRSALVHAEQLLELEPANN